MTRTELREQLVKLFGETAEAHHRAFASTDGADPEWPIWYAGHLHEPLSEALGSEFNRCRLVFCLMKADQEHNARGGTTPWPDFYADHFIECFAEAVAPQTDQLALYMTPTCPFCRLVLRALEEIDVDVELRDIFADTRHRDDLVAARGRATVPVLRITSFEEDRWMPESRDIVRYLQDTYGRKQAA